MGVCDPSYFPKGAILEQVDVMQLGKSVNFCVAPFDGAPLCRIGDDRSVFATRDQGNQLSHDLCRVLRHKIGSCRGSAFRCDEGGWVDIDAVIDDRNNDIFPPYTTRAKGYMPFAIPSLPQTQFQPTRLQKRFRDSTFAIGSVPVFSPCPQAKAGVSPPLRKLLGYHVDATELSVNTYSRDLLAPPLRELVRVLSLIASGAFSPDTTRSGYFASNDPGRTSALTPLPQFCLRRPLRVCLRTLPQ